MRARCAFSALCFLQRPRQRPRLPPTRAVREAACRAALTAASLPSRPQGLSWDAERGLWKETKPRGAFGSLSSGGWDLRGSATFKSPASLLRIRSQAEKIFNDNVSESLFTSPTMQRFKKQTDDMFASLTAYVPVSIISDTRNFFSSWFG